MDISDYDVTELTFEEACAAVGGTGVCWYDPDLDTWFCDDPWDPGE